MDAFNCGDTSIKGEYAGLVSLEQYGVELHLVRHGEDERGKVGGWSDNHLTEKGIKQIEDLVPHLDKDYDVLISSDLVRTKESASIINKALGREFVYDDSFREVNNGDLKNLSITEFKTKYPGLYYSSLKMDECYPGGESPNMFCDRIKKAFFMLLEKNKGKKILLVTHGGVITVILCCVHGIPYSNLLKIAPPEGTLTKVK